MGHPFQASYSGFLTALPVSNLLVALLAAACLCVPKVNTVSFRFLLQQYPFRYLFLVSVIYRSMTDHLNVLICLLMILWGRHLVRAEC